MQPPAAAEFLRRQAASCYNAVYCLIVLSIHALF